MTKKNKKLRAKEQLLLDTFIVAGWWSLFGSVLALEWFDGEYIEGRWRSSEEGLNHTTDTRYFKNMM